MLKFISNRNLIEFLDGLSEDYAVLVPVRKETQRFYKRHEPHTDGMVIGEVRTFDPLKAFFFRPRERVAEGFESSMPGAPSEKPSCLVGVKACDLKGFKIQDHVFGDHELADPFYTRARRQNLIISADCTCAIETCFCLALGVQPHPTELFDLNLSTVREGYVVETGSPKGESLLEKHDSLFDDAKAAVLAERDEMRARVITEVQANIAQNQVPFQDSLEGAVARQYESDLWQEEARNCVECGACNTICPTCHCFYLYDQKDQAAMARFRLWDSCMVKDFARVAGGANPRPKLWMRLRNRFEKKFDFFPKIAGTYACTGCGRCISACPAKIDIRRVLRKLASHG